MTESTLGRVVARWRGGAGTRGVAVAIARTPRGADRLAGFRSSRGAGRHAVGYEAQLRSASNIFIAHARSIASVAFQLGAAIQSVHCARARSGITDCNALR